MRIPFILAIATALATAAPAQQADPSSTKDRVQPILAKHCRECHAGEKPKGDFRLDQLDPTLAAKGSEERWLSVAEQLRSGNMPPKKKPRLPEADLKAVTDWIDRKTAAAGAARRSSQGRVTLRRLNRSEYTNTVCDLLGVEVDLREQLALDGMMDGFDNVGSALHLSSFALERYVDAAGAALNVAIANTPAPASSKKRYSLKDQHAVVTYKSDFYRVLDDSVVCFQSSHDTAVWLSQFYPRDRGHFRVRISASGFQSAGKPVTFQVTSHTTGLVGYFDVPADQPKEVEFVLRLEKESGFYLLPYGLGNACSHTPGRAANYAGPGLAVHWVEVEGPLAESWPPASHRRLFGDLPQAPFGKWKERLEVVSQNPPADADRILRPFLRRAFRRPVTDLDLQPFLSLVRARLAEKDSFEQALRTALAAVLTSPKFLFLEERPGPLDDFALASRLSYFFWSSMPDDELFELAEKKELRRSDVLRGQVERMLKSPKARAFTSNFCGQWLGLRDIDFTAPHYGLYPEFDQMLKVSMVRETELFFEELLKDDLSVANFVASDFSMLNGRLAKHYGIAGVDGLWEFRRVALPPDCHRGGVLTMASVLKVTADGTNTSPVKRGAWVLDRILGTPPPKPPPDISALEPDTRGATTIREQLAKHRNNPSCAGCHARIDPAGLALESFDVIGGWRTYYRQTTWAKGVKEVKGVLYLQGPDVDASGETADGRPFRGIDEFRKYLLQEVDQLARGMAQRLATYATGGAPEAADRAEIEAIVSRLRERKYGFRTLVHEIVQSRMFREK
jgi:mono/diheme cytochrome c family protein